MSGVLALLCGAQGGGDINTAWAVSLFRATSGGATASASATFNPGGTASATGGGAPGNWFLPTTAGVGNGWSVRVTGGGGGATVSGMTSGVWYALSVSQTVAYSVTIGYGSGSAAVAFSPDNGVTVVAAGSIDWELISEAGPPA